ncbi:MAG: benzoate/H(+) symporter BenE family transporter [Nocardioides sp.]|uniref:benzoate/H(+) symporter BenE family transporter n=1 Tax=Nocardioides sp. TaxID=35761 RepID=UPI0039E6F603
MEPIRRPLDLQPMLAGLVTALVGFTSSYAVVLAGLRGVGASTEQAASGLLAVCLTQALGMLWLTHRYRIPLTLAWSTPGAAVLAGSGVPDGGWPAAVGAFGATGALILATALWPRLGALIALIPASLAQAMLAGVLLSLCIAPVTGVVDHPWLVGPPVLVWLVLVRLAPRWAVPAAFAVALATIGLDLATDGGWQGPVLPHLELTTPRLSWGALVGIAIPLYVVTMASQNVPGVAVMSGYGYAVPWRSTMAVTGTGTMIGSVAGGHAINLAAITAALAASPDAHPDPARRWIAARTAAWAYLVLALLSTALTSLVSAAPTGVVQAVAGLGLFATLGSALAGALGAATGRESAVVTFLVAASGVTLAGVGAAFWALLAGLVVLVALGGARPGLSRSSDPRHGTSEPTASRDPDPLR